MTAQARLMVLILSLTLAFGAGFFFNDYLGSREEVAPTYRAGKVHKEGTVEIARVPYEKPKFKAPINPKKSKQVATVELEIQPDDPVLKPRTVDTYPVVKECLTVADFMCPPVKLRLDLNELDGQHVVTAKAQNGQIMDSIHIPYQNGRLPKDKHIVGTYAQDGAYTVVAMKDVFGGRIALGGGIAASDGRLDPLLAVQYSWR